MGKKLLSMLTIALLALGVFTGCSTKPKEPAKTPDGKIILKVGTFMVPHSEILEGMLPLAEKQGLAVEIVDFTDPRKANEALAKGDLDINYVQSAIELERLNAEQKLSLVSLGTIHMEPLLLVSTRALDVSEIGPGFKIAVPNSADGIGRALRLLSEQGFLKLKTAKGKIPTQEDITENRLNLQLSPVDEATITNAVKDHDAAIVTGVQLVFAKESLQIPIKNLASEAMEGSEFAAVVAVRKGDEKRAEVQAFMKVLQSNEARLFIMDKYNGAVGPAF